MPEPYEICLLSLPCVFLVLAIISIYIASTLTDMACRFKAQESIQELEDGALGKKLINQYSRVIERGQEDWKRS